MQEFRIWGPLAKRIQLKYGEQMHAMAGPDEHGWWSVTVEKAEPGVDYAFMIDDDPTPYPDPRSLWQPKGVHGASRLYDQDSFRWTDEHWEGPPLTGAVIYELHIGTFSEAGTFDGAIAHLDHLAELGITHVEVMPVAEWGG